MQPAPKRHNSSILDPALWAGRRTVLQRLIKMHGHNAEATALIRRLDSGERMTPVWEALLRGVPLRSRTVEDAACDLIGQALMLPQLHACQAPVSPRQRARTARRVAEVTRRYLRDLQSISRLPRIYLDTAALIQRADERWSNAELERLPSFDRLALAVCQFGDHFASSAEAAAAPRQALAPPDRLRQELAQIWQKLYQNPDAGLAAVLADVLASRSPSRRRTLPRRREHRRGEPA